jgi:SAM-dependent methyltransferase
MTKYAFTHDAEVLEDRTRSEKETIYVLGHSQDEIGRLIGQAAILRSTTERLLRSAGIEQGMRVLDLGCGAGDVSMLAGKLVGPSGSVIGIDPNADILAVARARAQADGLPHVVAAETVAIDTLESRLRSAVVEARSQVEGTAQVCAWTRV